MVLIAGTLSMISGSPSLLSPNAIVAIMPTLLVAISPFNNPELPYRITVLSIISAIPMAAIYYFWVKSLSNKIPRRSIILFLVVFTLSIPYFIFSWSLGVTWQGLSHTVFMVTINIVVCMLLISLLVSNIKAPGNSSASLFHGILFCWLVWCALPVLGELP